MKDGGHFTVDVISFSGDRRKCYFWMGEFSVANGGNFTIGRGKFQ
jgi:hypothetical protein